MKNFFIVLLSCTLALGAGAAERTAVVTGLPGTDGIGANEVPVMETGGQPMPDEWIDKDTGHRVVKLTRRPGSNASFYFPLIWL